eukprot:364703-Chlamydomonas_euryale.AAC.6
MTTVFAHGVRVRTAQLDAFLPAGEQPNSASFYREYRLSNFTEWKARLDEVRAANNVLSADYCAWDSASRLNHPTASRTPGSRTSRLQRAPT